MRQCRKCKKTFPVTIIIDGQIRNLGSRSFCLECSPFGQHNTSKSLETKQIATVDTLDTEYFKRLVSESWSRSEICSKLNLRKSSASFAILNRRIAREGLNTSHFRLGGETANNRRYSNEEIFVLNVKTSHQEKVRRRLIKDKLLEYSCKNCGLNTWQNKTITLELDHINGNRNDNRLNNLRFLCPNCHSQTETFGGRNIGKQHESRADGLHP